MSKYTDRRWEVLIDDKSFATGQGSRQFKMTFEVLIDYGNFNSYADIVFTNLTHETASEAFTRGSKISLRAGYGDSTDTIFTGFIRNVFRRREGPNTLTQVIARGSTLVTERPTVNTAIGEGSSITDAITAIAEAMNLPLEIEEDQFKDKKKFIGGYTMTGDPIVYLTELAESFDFSYVVVNGRLIVTENSSFRPGEVHEISQFTGMEGIPVITEVGADVTVRLNPKLKIGGRYRIEATSATFNFSNLYYVDVPESAGKGEYRIFRLTHTGDTWGDSWSTKIVGYR